MGVIYKNGIAYGGGGGSEGGTSDYADLTNKPRINNVVLTGNKTIADLRLADGSTIYINDDNQIAIGIISDNAIDDLFN